jgi:hypothetical protein
MAWMREHRPRRRRCRLEGAQEDTTMPEMNQTKLQSMPTGATTNLFLLAGGFGIGALVVLFGFVFLVGIGAVGHDPASNPTPAAQSAATAPAAPGPAPRPAPQTGTAETTGQASKPEPAQKAPAPNASKPEAKPADPAKN